MLRLLLNLIWLHLDHLRRVVVALEHLVIGVLLAITIIGIPPALANFKMIPLALTPFGRKIVPVEHASSAGFVA